MNFAYFALLASCVMSGAVGFAIQDGQYWAAGGFVPMAVLTFLDVARRLPPLKGTPDGR